MIYFTLFENSSWHGFWVFFEIIAPPTSWPMAYHCGRTLASDVVSLWRNCTVPAQNNISPCTATCRENFRSQNLCYDAVITSTGARMTIEKINIEATVKRVNDLIAAEKNLSPALKASLEVLLLLISILANSLGLNSKNSSKPPSTDPNRQKEPKQPGDQKPGGQNEPLAARQLPGYSARCSDRMSSTRWNR